jgi:hypothetical protein
MKTETILYSTDFFILIGLHADFFDCEKRIVWMA